MIIECTDEALRITTALLERGIGYEYRVVPLPSTNSRQLPTWIVRITINQLTAENMVFVVRLARREITNLVHDLRRDPVHGIMMPRSIANPANLTAAYGFDHPTPVGVHHGQ